ncbi:hypothetical protein ACQUSR_28010 [Streptomyces sp. P1-3]|uniref:hypothetical protein n=1 Tax=Streptomyces sp. P1-3 TaxID=3421658 RepID=UPI003D36E0A9
MPTAMRAPTSRPAWAAVRSARVRALLFWSSRVVEADAADVQHGPAVAGSVVEPVGREVDAAAEEDPAVGFEDEQAVLAGGSVAE